MATLQLMPVTTINGTTYATAQLILQPATPEKAKTKNILPKQEPISPPKTDLNMVTPDFLRICQKSENAKRRIHFSKKALTHPRPQAVTRRNARERNRVKAVNQGFVTLANHVPPYLRSKKMSKVDTLKAAISYIKALQEALHNDGVMPSLDSDFSEIASSPAVSTTGSESSSLPSSPSCTPSSTPSYTHKAPEITCQPQMTCYQPSTQFSQYPIQRDHLQQQYHASMQQQYAHTDNYQPQCNYFDTYNKVPSRFSDPYYNIDYTRPTSTEMCPSPTSSNYSSDHEHMEAEILEFASWFQ